MKIFGSLSLCFWSCLSYGQHQRKKGGYDMLFLGAQDYTYNLYFKDILKYILPDVGLNILGLNILGAYLVANNISYTRQISSIK